MQYALPLAMAMLRRCFSHDVSLASPVSSVILRPSSVRNTLVLLPITPVVSTDTGWKRCLSVRFLYFSSFERSAWLAAWAGFKAQCTTWVGAKVSAHVDSIVESHTRGFPFVIGMTVRPSGRRPSPLSRPGGSKLEGMPAVVSDLLIMSLMLACLGCLKTPII